MNFGLFDLGYSVFFIFINSPLRTEEQNDAARARFTRRLEKLAWLARTYNYPAHQFAADSLLCSDRRGQVFIVPHEIVPELA